MYRSMGSPECQTDLPTRAGCRTSQYQGIWFAEAFSEFCALPPKKVIPTTAATPMKPTNMTYSTRVAPSSPRFRLIITDLICLHTICVSLLLLNDFQTMAGEEQEP